RLDYISRRADLRTDCGRHINAAKAVEGSRKPALACAGRVFYCPRERSRRFDQQIAGRRRSAAKALALRSPEASLIRTTDWRAPPMPQDIPNPSGPPGA